MILNKIEWWRRIRGQLKLVSWGSITDPNKRRCHNMDMNTETLIDWVQEQKNKYTNFKMQQNFTR